MARRGGQDSSDLLMWGLVAGGGYLAYKQGWLSFLGIGAPAAVAAPVAAAPTVPIVTPAVPVVPVTPATPTDNGAAAQQAQMDAARILLRVRRDLGGVAQNPVSDTTRFTRLPSTTGSLSGLPANFRIRKGGMYGR